MLRSRGRESGVSPIAAVLLTVLLLTGLAGCAVLDQRSRPEMEAAYGPNPPRIEASFASRNVSPEDTWKIYIKGSDPDGDLRFVNVALWFSRGNMTPIRLDVAQDQGRSISGFLTLDIWALPDSVFRFGSGDLRLSVALEDRAGHISERFLLAVGVLGGATQEPPPAGVFEERSLGNIPVQFIQIDSIGGASWP